MKLIEVIERISDHNPEATIYLKQPWDDDSDAYILDEVGDADEVGRLPDGVEYFLEVSIAREFLEDWKASLNCLPSLAQTCQRLISYAKNDA